MVEQLKTWHTAVPRLLISRDKNKTNNAHNLVFDRAFESLQHAMAANHCFKLFGLKQATASDVSQRPAATADPTPSLSQWSKVQHLKYVKDVALDYKPIIYSSRARLVRYLRTEILINNSSLALSDTTIEALALGLGFVMHASFSNDCPVRQLANENRSWRQKINRAIKGASLAAHRAARGQQNKPLRGVLHASGRLDRTDSDCDPSREREEFNNKHFNSLNQKILETLLGDKNIDEKENTARRPLYESIATLGANKEIHVIQADKGGAICVIDTADYDREAQRQLEDKNTYTELTEEEFKNGLQQTAQIVQDIADQLYYEGNISRIEYDVFLAKLTSPDGSYIYFLPKIHKEWNASTNAFPGRPIAATFACVVNTLDKYITELTTPLLSIIPGSLRDTSDLLNKLPKGPLPKLAKWVTSDVNSLYPSIPWGTGIEAATAFYADNITFLRKYNQQHGLLQPPSVQNFCDAITTVITRSFISFKGRRFFQQASGTSMGSCISVYLANTYMFQLTRHLIPHKNSTAPQRPAWLLLFERYIDDLILIVDGCTTKQLDNLFKSISNETIGYTTTAPETTAPALDVLLSINQNTLEIETEPYSKPTSKATFLHARSTHPGHSINSLPYAQYVRLLRIASSREAFEKHAARLTASLLLRDYPKSVLHKALEKARTKKREELLSRVNNKTQLLETGTSIASSIKYTTKFRSSVAWTKARRILKLAHATITHHFEHQTLSHNPRLSAIYEAKFIAELFSTKPSAFVYSVHNSTRAMLTCNYKRPRTRNYKHQLE